MQKKSLKLTTGIMENLFPKLLLLSEHAELWFCGWWLEADMKNLPFQIV